MHLNVQMYKNDQLTIYKNTTNNIIKSEKKQTKQTKTTANYQFMCKHKKKKRKTQDENKKNSRTTN